MGSVRAEKKKKDKKKKGCRYFEEHINKYITYLHNVPTQNFQSDIFVFFPGRWLGIYSSITFTQIC